MIVIIAYDIADHRRRRKFADTLSEIGWRLQESVFECRLVDTSPEDLSRVLRRMINTDTDTVHMFRQCRTCHQHRTGTNTPTDTPGTHWCT